LNKARKFTEKGRQIALRVDIDGSDVVLRVRDNGIGIAAQHLPRLFDMFTQVETSLDRSRDGLGIGLTLVKTLVELQGGRVEAHSEGLGRGSEFVVRLPIAVDQPVRPALPALRGLAASGAKRRVLVVDDNEDGAESLALLLTLNGHEAYIAHDGTEAIEVAERERPDVVLLDIGLPGLNGFEVSRRIRERTWGKDVVLVAVTGWGQDEHRRASTEAGFDAHLVKPVDHDALMALVASVPSRRDANN
jgi:CheY-like chemotaxis protein